MKNSDGQFLGFDQLTYVPLDLDAIDKQYLQAKDIKAINDYHAEVYKRIEPLIEEPEIKEWLKEATRAI